MARRQVILVLMAVVSAATLVAPRMGSDVLAWVLVLGCPVVVAVLGFRQRDLEEGLSRVLVTAVTLIAAGQVVAVALSRTPLLDPSAALPTVLLLFGVPITVVLCVLALTERPQADQPHD